MSGNRGSRTRWMVYGAATLAVGFLVLNHLAHIWAHRLPNCTAEVVAIGDIRAMQQAQTAYARDNAGYFGAIGCLRKPADCGATEETPSYLPRDLARAPLKREGYWRVFYHGAPAPDAPRTNSLVSYAYVATPAGLGVRGFAGDFTGRRCFTADGSEPPGARHAKLDPRCEALD